MKNIAVIIPAFNAGSTIETLIQKASEFISTKDIVVVDDGSNDQTYNLSKKAGVVVLRHQSNEGKGEALKTGFRFALDSGYDAFITMDADLQHDPESIPHFVHMAEGSAGILVGTRRRNLQIMPLARWLTNNLTSVIVSVLSGRSIRDSQSGYRLINARVLKRVKLESKKYDLESELLIKAARKGFKVGEVPITTIYGSQKSFINPLVDTGRFIRLMWKSLWW
jgi:glycosyltransferase involved in cell wall biosynthesis